MKHVKFIFIFLLLFILLVGCQKSEEKSFLEQYVETFQIPTEVKASDYFNLDPNMSDIENNITIAWTSNNLDVIDEKGILYFTEDDTTVVITLTFSKDSESIQKDYSITLLGAETIEMLEIAAKHYEIQIVSKNSNPYLFDFNLPSRIKYCDKSIKVSWSSSNPEIISNTGLFNYPAKSTTVSLQATLTYDGESYTHSYTILTELLDQNSFAKALSNISIPNETAENLDLPQTINVEGFEYNVEWESNLADVISNEGKLSYVSKDTEVCLTASTTIKNIKISKEFKILAQPTSGQAAIDIALSSIKIPDIINNDILLSESIYGVQIKWTSSNPSILDNNGKINKNSTSFKSIKLTADMTAGTTKVTEEYDVQVSYQSHMFIDRTFEGTKENLEIANNKLILSDGKLTGTYTTNIIECDNFKECVGSYSATSSKTEICELKVRIRINNTWTKYFTYGEFGKGLQNGYSNQTSTNSKMLEDEISATSGSANAFQLQLIVKRSSLKEQGPIVSLLALSIDYITHNYSVDIKNLPSEVKHDVPKLYQHVVPSIGGSICSITSSTMLMMYRGYSFDGLATYPHEYMAGILKDYGHNIFGNWSYNCIGMGSFGANAYVKRFYSYEEIMHHLYYVGPVAASIKGTFITDAKTYTTNGHLIVITGYKIEGGKTYFYINDPNISVVSTKCTLEALTSVNRMVSYIIEK